MPTKSKAQTLSADSGRQLLNEVAALSDKAELHVTLLTGKPPDAFEFHRLNLDQGLANKFRQICAEFAQPLANGVRLGRYSAGENYSGGDIVGFMAPSEAIQSLVPKLEANTGNPLLDPSSLGNKRVRMYVVSVREPNSNWIHLLNETNARFRLEQKGFLATIFSRGVYTELEEEALLFGRDFDAIFTSSIALVIQQKSLQRALGILAQVSKQSKTILKAVTGRLRIKNYQEFETAVSAQLNMVPRLMSIKERFDVPAYAAAMTIDNIVAFAKENPKLEIDFEGESGNEELVFYPDPQRCWKILQLLDDDFLVSDLTKFRYESSSKSPLQ
jgi:hypothetical protein